MNDELVDLLEKQGEAYYFYALAETAKSDLFFLAKEVLGYRDILQRTHGPIIDALQKPNKRKLIVCPRGSFKSSLCVVSFSILRLLQRPNIRILIDSELYTNSKGFIREIQAHLESELMTAVFGEFKTRRGWSEGAITIAQRTKNYKEPTILAGGIGTEKTGLHFDLIIMDDLNSPNNSQTPEARAKVIDHYRYCNAILEPDGEMVIVGTRYSSDDLIGHVLANEMGLDPMNGGKAWIPEQMNRKGLIL